jgi:hypothetical protein
VFETSDKLEPKQVDKQKENEISRCHDLPLISREIIKAVCGA